MLHLLQMGPSKVLTTFIPNLELLAAFTLRAAPPLPQHCDFLLRLLRHVYLHCTISPLFSNAALRPTLVFKLLIPPPAHFISFLCPLTTVACFWLPFYASCLFSPLTLSGFFNGMLEVFKPKALNYFTFFHPILSTLPASRNPILTLLPLFGFLDSLLCLLITLTPGLVFSLLMPRTLAAASSFSSGRASLNFLPSLLLCLIPALIV